MRAFIEKYARLSVWLPLLLVWPFGFNGFLFWLARHVTEKGKPLDLSPRSSPDAVYSFLAEIGEVGRAEHVRTWAVDLVVVPAIYTVVFLLIVGWGLKKAAPVSLADPIRLRIWTAMVLFPGVADLVENTLIGIILFGYPERHDTVAAWLGTVTTVKWGGAAVVAALVIMALVHGLPVEFVEWRQRRKQQKRQ